MTKSEFEEYIDSKKFRFAKTYASFCPHEYIIKKWYVNTEDFSKFEDVCQFIMDNGFEAWYYKNRNICYIYGENYYFLLSTNKKEWEGLNRAKLSDFNFEYDEAKKKTFIKRQK